LKNLFSGFQKHQTTKPGDPVSLFISKFPISSLYLDITLKKLTIDKNQIHKDLVMKSRKEQIKSEVNRILSIVSEDDTVSKVILFGSSADLSLVNEWSDIDCCIIQQTKLRFLDRIVFWIDRIEPQLGMDLVVYTPEEFDILKETNSFVCNEIVAKGRALYAA